MSPDPLGDNTRARILELVETLIMERGFNAISYQDVASGIGIRKASIHYYFPAKADLGAAVIARYVEKLAPAMAPIETLAPSQFAPAFERFLDVFAAVAASAKRVCLGGVLGAEFQTLPEAMQVQVRRFYDVSQSWAAALLEAGREAGSFRFAGDARETAKAIVAMLEGALIIARALDDPGQAAIALSYARRMIGLGA